jgi:dTDP-glucose pyrophosphorylase
MIILIPMAGAGSRFAKAGYEISKPVIPTTNRKTGEKIPMVVAATNDVPNVKDVGTKVVYIDRDFHKKEGVEEEIKRYYPDATFITIDYLTEGQMATCMLAKDLINNDEELFIGACDNGMDFNLEKFKEEKKDADAFVISHSNDDNIAQNPNAHSWALLEDDGKTIKKMSIKKTVSENPMNDHATTGAFWFKRGSDFVKAAQKMLANKDKTGGEYYVDQLMQYAIDLGVRTQVFDVKYICWGTPKDYEDYEETIKYWTDFSKKEEWIK